MQNANGNRPQPGPKPPRLTALIQPYRGLVTLLIVLALFSNGLNLVLPRIIAYGIDAYGRGETVFKPVITWFALTALCIFIFTYLQNIVQTYASERVARDLRTRLAAKVSQQTYAGIQSANPSRLLTNFTSDIDTVKLFVSQAIVSIASSLIIITGAAVLLFSINWELALAVLAIIPLIGATFFIVLRKMRVWFMKIREVIDWLNKVITESILGAALIRVLNAQGLEYDKFLAANTDAKNIGLTMIRLYALMIPVITFIANMAMVTILAMGGHYVIAGKLTLGNLAAFNSYLAILIFPVILIGVMSNVIAQASAAYQRVQEMLSLPDPEDSGTVQETLRGDIALQNIGLQYEGRPVLKDISFTVKAGSRTAIIGPTAAGKTQLLYLLANLAKPDSGHITYDGRDIRSYHPDALHRQVGLVFQDSILFNMSLRENIAFNDAVTDDALQRAIHTAALKDFIDTLPQGLDTIVSERGTSLSGGQKQRIMLARALAINPTVLLLDDFTARVDNSTEQQILQNLAQHYPHLTLLSVTQKISSIEQYDKIILLMEGEIIAAGTHAELLQTCPEYVQIYQSQRSTSAYELQSE
ncbi:ABC transporter ATP-binding protein [Chitinophaga japonensis]|uniref:ABC-type multidrug transport system fused ATPase/permease subunit n=1 Tax=Chitinophaga japonensis TaxID=104662 RepID=A0A562T3X3_CHIJA|nr:ABC transporter ATP-binding protein [Chitinophaga japonensis]TWI88237.1 ABC-type multidrug transport system fused ATPase/permease subunit [Chitinophaga japonensis]